MSESIYLTVYSICLTVCSLSVCLHLRMSDSTVCMSDSLQYFCLSLFENIWQYACLTVCSISVCLHLRMSDSPQISVCLHLRMTDSKCVWQSVVFLSVYIWECLTVHIPDCLQSPCLSDSLLSFGNSVITYSLAWMSKTTTVRLTHQNTSQRTSQILCAING